MLPSEAVTETFPIILSAFVTTLAFLWNIAISDSQDDLTNATLFQQPGFAEECAYVDDNYTEFERRNYTVAVSCGCVVKDIEFYRIFYAGTLVSDTFSPIDSLQSIFPPKFWHIRRKLDDKSKVDTSRASEQRITGVILKKDAKTATKTIIGSLVFNLSLLMLLLSFDISPWSCIQTPSAISAIIFQLQTGLTYTFIMILVLAILFQQGTVIISAILMCVWGVFHVVFLCHDYIKGDVDRTVNLSDSLIPL